MAALHGYLVTWRIDADPEDAATPYEAAVMASRVQGQQTLDGEDGTGFFEVAEKDTGKKWTVDLESGVVTVIVESR